MHIFDAETKTKSNNATKENAQQISLLNKVHKHRMMFTVNWRFPTTTITGWMSHFMCSLTIYVSRGFYSFQAWEPIFSPDNAHFFWVNAWENYTFLTMKREKRYSAAIKNMPGIVSRQCHEIKIPYSGTLISGQNFLNQKLICCPLQAKVKVTYVSWLPTWNWVSFQWSALFELEAYLLFFLSQGPKKEGIIVGRYLEVTRIDIQKCENGNAKKLTFVC